MNRMNIDARFSKNQKDGCFGDVSPNGMVYKMVYYESKDKFPPQGVKNTIYIDKAADYKMYLWNVDKQKYVDTDGVLDDNGYESMMPVGDIDETYLAYVSYNSLDYANAKKYFDEGLVGNFPMACSSVVKDGVLARNYDWNYSEACEFVVRTPAMNNRHAVLGVVGQVKGLTKDFVKIEAYSGMYKVLPFLLVDGKNDCKLKMSINVVPNDKGNTTGTLEGKERINALMFVRWALDYCDSIDDVVRATEEDISIYVPEVMREMGYEVHFIVSDDTKTKVLEFVDNECVWTDADKMTNFFINGVTFKENGEVPIVGDSDVLEYGLTPRSEGLERYNIIVNHEGTLDELVEKLKYTNLYTLQDHKWYSELCGTDELTIDSPMYDFDHVMAIARRQYDVRSRETALTSQSVHSVIYSDDKLKIFTQENYEDSFEFDLPEPIVTGVKGSNEAKYRFGNVNISPDNIGLGNVDNTSDMDKPISNAQQDKFDEIEEEIGEIVAGKIENIKIGNTLGTVEDNVAIVGNATQESDGGMSSIDKTKLDGIEEGAEVNKIESVDTEDFAITESKNLKVADGKQLTTSEQVTKLDAIEVDTQAKSVTDGTNTLSDLVSDANYVHTDNNYTDEEKNKLDGVEDNAQVNILEGVKVNGSELSITDKKVNVTISEGTDNGTIKVNGEDINVHGLGSAAYEDADEFDEAGAAANAVQAAMGYTDQEVASATELMNKVVMTNSEFSYDGDTVTLTKSKVNVKTGATSSSEEVVQLADDENAGMMSPAQVSALSDLGTRVEALEGRTIRLLYEAKPNPSAAEIEAFVRAQGYTDQTHWATIGVVVRDTNHIWRCFSTTEGSTITYEWRDIGLDTVQQFTNTMAGVIKGAGAVAGKVYAEDDGTGSVYGWDALNTRVANLESGSQGKIVGEEGQFVGFDEDGAAEAKTPDSTPTQNSTNLVTSGGVYSGLDAKADKESVYTQSEIDEFLSDKADLVEGKVPAEQLPDPVWEAGSGLHSVATVGNNNQAIGESSVAEGAETDAHSFASHTEGYMTSTGVDAAYSHAEGYKTSTQGQASHAEGDNTVTNNPAEHAEGKYNKSNMGGTPDTNTISSIGIGNASGSVPGGERKNAVEVMQNGDNYMFGVGGYDGKNPSDSSSVQEVINNKQDSIDDLDEIRSGASAGATALQPSDLSPYRTSSNQDIIDNGIKDRISTIEGKETSWDEAVENVTILLSREIRKYTSTITGDGTKSSFIISLPSELQNKQLIVQLHDSNNDVILTDIHKTTTSITIEFGEPVESGTTYSVIIIG